MSYDTVVVGAGLAGLVAALRLAEGGARVAVVAKGQGSLGLAPGTIDVLGYAPDRVDAPAGALPGFVRANPDHPYGRVPEAEIAAAVRWLLDRSGPLEYRGGLERNFLLCTPAGVVKPSAAVPASMAAGDLAGPGRLLLVGFAQFKDFYPSLAAANLAAALPDGEFRGVTVEAPAGAERDLTAMELARRFEAVDFREAVVKEIERAADGEEEAVGLPAVLGLHDASPVWADLRERLGRPVFEIPTVPPSVPGLRLSRLLRDRLRALGARVVVGSEVVETKTEGDRVLEVRAQGAARAVTYRADWFVLASGGLSAGGIAMDSRGHFRETVFGLPVAGAPPPQAERFGLGYFDRHPAARAGVAVDDELRPAGPDGVAVLENLRVAGATLHGAEPWREKSGEGISLATGYRAAGLILAAAGKEGS